MKIRFRQLGLYRKTVWLIVALLGALWTLGEKSANAASVVISEPQLEGELSPSEKTQLRSALESALKSQQLAPIAQTDLEATLSGEAQLQGCHTELCYERLGRLLDGQMVVRYRVRRGEGKTPVAWRFSVEVLDVEVGAFGAKLSEDCPSCNDKQAAEKLGDLAKRAIIESVARPRGTLDIRSEPSGAAVFVDGTELGITPYKRTTFAGPHKVVLRHVGYRSEQVDAVIEDGQKQRIERKLTVGTDPTKMVVIEKTPVYKKWWFWVALGGAVAVAASVTAGVVIATRPAASTDRTPPSNNLSFSF